MTVHLGVNWQTDEHGDWAAAACGAVGSYVTHRAADVTCEPCRLDIAARNSRRDRVAAAVAAQRTRMALGADDEQTECRLIGGQIIT